MASPKKKADEGKTDGQRLTGKQSKFVDAYLGVANGNATEAARIAGYALPAEQGCDNLKKPNIRAMIDARLEESAMSAREVLSRLTEHARSSVADFATINHNGEPAIDLTRAERSGKLRLIREVSYSRHGPTIRLYDAQAALALLGKYHGLFREQPPVPPDGTARPRIVIPDFDAGSTPDDPG